MNFWFYLSCCVECMKMYLKQCNHTQARSQDLEKGGLVWKSEKSANNLDPNFHCSWIRITRFVRKLRQNFSETSEIHTFFRPKTGDLQKKTKKNKKKRSSPKFRLHFPPISEIQALFQTESRHVLYNFFTTSASSQLGGGLFSIFHQKSASKAPKTGDFAYFIPPLATLLITPFDPFFFILRSSFTRKMSFSNGKNNESL